MLPDPNDSSILIEHPCTEAELADTTQIDGHGLPGTLDHSIKDSGLIVFVTGVNPYMAGLACCIGSIGITNLHDSYFWVVNRTTGLTDVKEMLWHWFGAVLALSAAGVVTLFVMNLIVG